MGKVIYWKPVKEGLTYQQAMQVFQTGEVNGKTYDELAIQVLDQRFIRGKDNPQLQKFYPHEFLYHNWEVLIPDTNKEDKLCEIRKLLKETNCSDLPWSAIDNMTIPQLFEHITERLDDNQKYKMLKTYCENR